MYLRRLAEIANKLDDQNEPELADQLDAAIGLVSTPADTSIAGSMQQGPAVISTESSSPFNTKPTSPYSNANKPDQTAAAGTGDARALVSDLVGLAIQSLQHQGFPAEALTTPEGQGMVLQEVQRALSAAQQEQSTGGLPSVSPLGSPQLPEYQSGSNSPTPQPALG